MPQISIIMPLYNAQKFLKESLDSVLNQTFQEFELICINDGSEDETLSIVKQYQENDSRILILENEKRSGAAYSRNRGINKAKGKYILFLDGDDIFEEEMLEVTYKVAEEKNTEVLIFEYKHVSSEYISEKAFIYHGNRYIQKYCTEVFSIKNSLPYEILLFTDSPCNKIFKRDFIVNNQISFQNLASSNDVYFVEMALMLSERTMVLADNRVMIYARDHMEPSRISRFRDPMCCFNAFEHLMNELIERNKMEELYQHFFYKAIFSFKNALEKAKDRSIAKQFYKFLQEEGILRLYDDKSKEFLQNNEYISSVFSKFKDAALTMKWIEEEVVLNPCLEDKKNIFSELFRVRDKGYKIILWGIGKNGKAILEACDRCGLSVDYVVDKNTEKHGCYIKEYCIMRPDMVLTEPALVIISPSGFLDEIKKEVLGYNENSVVLEINDYMALI